MIIDDVFSFLPPDSSQRERAVLILYYLIEIKKPKDIAKILGYKYPTSVYRILKKYRGHIFFPWINASLHLQGRREPINMEE